jgi:hypothetical protein
MSKAMDDARRTAIDRDGIEDPEEVADGRLVMLGTPNYGDPEDGLVQPAAGAAPKPPTR